MFTISRHFSYSRDLVLFPVGLGEFDSRVAWEPLVQNHDSHVGLKHFQFSRDFVLFPVLSVCYSSSQKMSVAVDNR